MKPYFGSEIAEHDVTMTPFPADLIKLQFFSLVRMRVIDVRRGIESLVTLLASVWELSRKECTGGQFDPPPLRDAGVIDIILSGR